MTSLDYRTELFICSFFFKPIVKCVTLAAALINILCEHLVKLQVQCKRGCSERPVHRRRSITLATSQCNILGSFSQDRVTQGVPRIQMCVTKPFHPPTAIYLFSCLLKFLLGRASFDSLLSQRQQSLLSSPSMTAVIPGCLIWYI